MATVDEVRAWLQANPNVPDTQVATLMRQYGVSPEMMAQASGKPIQEVQARFDSANRENDSMNTPTGLYGAEQALGQGYESALNSLMQGVNQGREDLMAYDQRAQGQYDQSYNDITQGRDQALAQASQGFDRAESYFKPYAEMGQRVNPLLEALTGASGQQAFDDAYVQSPYMKFLEEQGGRAVTGNASALGGLGGGNVMKELTRFGQGLAGQGLQQQVNNLMGLSQQGFQGAQGGANLAAGQGQLLSGITTGAANSLAAQRAGAAGQSAQMGQNMGNLAFQGGSQAGNYGFNTGMNLAQGRTQAGQDLAASLSGASRDMASMMTNQGLNIANLIGQGGSNLAGLLAGTGMSQAELLQWLASGGANIAQGAASQSAGLPGIPGVQEQRGFVGRNSQAVGTALMEP